MASKRSSDLNDLFEEMCQLGEKERIWKRIDDISMSCIGLASPKIVSHTPSQLEIRIYGSTAEDLNCYMPHDTGDIDIMLYPTAEEATLDESMLEYVDGEPAFVRVRGKDHPLLRKCLYGETDFVATSTLKECDPTIFGIVPVLQLAMLPKIVNQICSISDGSSLAFENLEGPSFQVEFSQSLDYIKEKINRISLEKCDSFHKTPDDVKRLFDFIYANAINWDEFEKHINTTRNDIYRRIKKNPTEAETLEAVSDCHLQEMKNSKCMSLLAPISLRECFEDKHGGKAPTHEEFSAFERIFHKALLNSSKDSVSLPNQKIDQKMQSNDFQSGLDLVPSFKVRGWPQVAESWILRDRRWPSAEVISKIVDSGFHLVVKASTYQTARPDIDFRLSFSHAELLLSKELNSMQRECYRCLKLYYKALNQNKKPKIITTYFLKTTLLWSVEETGVEMWNENNRASCVMLLLEKLHHSLETKFLPHYFIPEFNLLEEAIMKYPKQLQSLADEVREICDNPIEWYHQRPLKSESSSSDKGKMSKSTETAFAIQSEQKNDSRSKFEFMSQDDFEELYRDVCREIVGMAMSDEICHVGNPTMQSIVDFLRCHLVGSESDDPEDMLLSLLPDSTLIRALHVVHNGRNARERIISAIKGLIDIESYVQSNDMEEESFAFVVDSILNSRGKNDLDLVNALMPQIGRYQEELMATFQDAFLFPSPQTNKTASDDGIPLD